MSTTNTACILVGLLLTLVASPSRASDAVPEVTHDGLQLQKNTKLARVWMKPGASLAGYEKIQILGCYVAFEKNWQEKRNPSQQVSAQRMDSIKKQLAAEFQKVFAEELGKGGYQVVEQPGHDVLVVRPAIIDLDVEAPFDPSGVGVTTFAASSGAMTLVAELYDSVTGDLLLRAIDPRADSGSGRFQMQDSVSNSASARRVLRLWADRLRKALDEAHSR